MMRSWARRQFLGSVGVLVVLVTALSTPSMAGGVGRSEDRVPRTLWKTYPLDPSGGTLRIDHGSGKDPRSGSQPKEEPGTTTPVAKSDTAHFSQQQGPTGGDRSRTYAYALGAGLLLLIMLMLVMTPAVRAARGFAGALETDTVVLFVSVVLVSVVVGVGVVLVVGPLLAR